MCTSAVGSRDRRLTGHHLQVQLKATSQRDKEEKIETAGHLVSSLDLCLFHFCS
ncbi:hypothetical protein I79_005904 [Cricetulus griseus]|uniref:Uncharacterized protein n=1 Tax=Cricetulus griseus TaxID=10029 RepID=G3H6E7_CRIGR|nr:hypothetical protein I79_005904 [Cricetulus griseus]